ncbi:MAG: 4-hydroxy-tetrahydrodipicolinate reductase [Candidatus Melainabacteria bacterium]|nr:4-hydroxy-tetrahydrodipicolinate reductase [Candidatus Melainabacteria bacterium]
MTEDIKVAIAGINGRMGRASVRAIGSVSNLSLVGAFGKPGASYVGQDVGAVVSTLNTGILVSNGFLDVLAQGNPDVLLDFTLAEAAFHNAQLALHHGVRPVIGTSGLKDKEIEALAQLAEKFKVGCMVVPNFSVGAVLMTEFAKQAAAMFGHVEIIEMHHTRKVDAPSGTAMYTASKLESLGINFNPQEVKEQELLPGARGASTACGVRLHSLRLPGLISHQEVIFGAEGELLTIRHDSFNADCFLKGITTAIRMVMQLDHLVVGLEHLLFPHQVPL